MLKQRIRLQAALVLALDLSLVAAAFFLAYAIRSWLFPQVLPGLFPRPLYPLSDHLPLLPLALLTWMAPLIATRRYRSHRTADLRTEATAILKVTAAATLLILFAVFVLQLDQILLQDRLSRTWLILFSGLSCVLLLAEKIAMRILARDLRQHGLNQRAVLIAGTPEAARQLAESIEDHSYWGLRIVGLIHTDGSRPANTARPVWGGVDDILRIVSEHVVDDVFFAVTPNELPALQQIFEALQEQGIQTRIALDLLPPTHSQVQLDSFAGRPVVTLSPAPSSLPLLAFKRSYDICLGVVLLAISLPVMLVLALLIKITSSGSVLYRQTRCGLNGRRFTMYKLRTMVADADARRGELKHLNTMGGPAFKMDRDPRITPLGHYLRKFSLDELPQFWNVVRGDMSIVGPRPLEEKEPYTRRQRRRLSMKPGITCLWQVSGRSDLDFDRWMELDLEYIDTWSPTLDFKIMLKTIPAVLSRRGAS
ncbi:MAG: sugar transferase [Acidobacteria bacterium]|nr:sugar transferase [Acidobacteriota bacterium]MCY3965499.1 sugar transferase [Acidobacteriota bacterium]